MSSCHLCHLCHFFDSSSILTWAASLITPFICYLFSFLAIIMSRTYHIVYSRVKNIVGAVWRSWGDITEGYVGDQHLGCYTLSLSTN